MIASGSTMAARRTSCRHHFTHRSSRGVGHSTLDAGLPRTTQLLRAMRRRGGRAHGLAHHRRATVRISARAGPASTPSTSTRRLQTRFIIDHLLSRGRRRTGVVSGPQQDTRRTRRSPPWSETQDREMNRSRTVPVVSMLEGHLESASQARLGVLGQPADDRADQRDTIGDPQATNGWQRARQLQQRKILPSRRRQRSHQLTGSSRPSAAHDGIDHDRKERHHACAHDLGGMRGRTRSRERCQRHLGHRP